MTAQGRVVNSTVRQLPRSDNSNGILMDVKDAFPGDLPAQKALGSLKCVVETPVGERTLFVLQFASPPENTSLVHLVRFVIAYSICGGSRRADAAPAPVNQEETPFRNYLIVAPKLAGHAEAIDTHDGMVTAMACQFNNHGFAYVASVQQQEIDDDPQGVRYDRENQEERLAKLSGGDAVVRVGAPSESEMKARKDAFDDAISSTKAAIAEGIVPGVGLALLRTMNAVEREAAEAEGDERTGLLILKRALESPARQIAENSAADGGVVVSKMREGTGSHGFDAARGVYVDLGEAGIIDPAKVVRIALENAVCVASVLLLTEATMTEVPEPIGFHGPAMENGME